MRSVRIATWTSGDPVSPDLVAYSLTSSCLRSALIDIGNFLTVCGFMMAGPGCRPARSALAGVRLPPDANRCNIGIIGGEASGISCAPAMASPRGEAAAAKAGADEGALM